MKKWVMLLLGAIFSCVLARGIAVGSEPAVPWGEVCSLARVTVVSLDTAGRKVSFLHEPTGYAFEASMPETASLERLRRMDPDEIPDGAFARCWGAIDSKAKTIRGEARIFSQPEPNPSAYVPGQTTIAGRLYRERLAKPESTNGWTTLDGISGFVLETLDSTRWKAIAAHGRPAVTLLETGTLDDFQTGRTADVTLKRVKNQWEITRAAIDVWPPGAELLNGLGHNRGNGPSGISADAYKVRLDSVVTRLNEWTPELDKLMPVTLTVAPQLVLPGEPVVFEIKVLAHKEPNRRVMLFCDFFHNPKKPGREIELAWKQEGGQNGFNVYTARAVLPSDKTGQYFLQWKSDSGGDIAAYSRPYAVCDRQSVVCSHQITTGGTPPPEAVFHELRIPLDYWMNVVCLDPWENGSPATLAGASRRYRQFGDNPCFLLEHYIWDTAQVRNEPDALQQLQVQALKQLVPRFGFDGSNISCWSYSLGNASYRMLQKEGGFTVTSLCTENHMDGGLEINHWGKPERPYFMSPEDFRKAGPGGKNATVALSQVQRLTYLARHYACDYNIEPASAPLVHGVGERTRPDEIFFSRILDFYDALFQMGRCQSGPYFITQGIEFDGRCFGAAEGNRKVIEYAVEKARNGNVVFANAHAVADFYKKHYAKTPESTCYFHDYFAGITYKDKPISLADSMSMENSALYALALHGQLLPEYQYDYSVTWDFPDFGNGTLPHRVGDGMAYMLPGKFDKYAATPKCVDTRAFQTSREDSKKNRALEIKVTVQSREERKALALSLWDIPRTFQKGTDWFRASPGTRFVPVQAPYTDNLNGFFIVDVKPGTNVFTLRINSAARKLRSLDFAIGSTLKGKVFTREGKPMAYVWNSLPWASSFSLTLPEGKAATVYVAPENIPQPCATGKTVFQIPQGKSLRIEGLTGKELTTFAQQP